MVLQSPECKEAVAKIYLRYMCVCVCVSVPLDSGCITRSPTSLCGAPSHTPRSRVKSLCFFKFGGPESAVRRACPYHFLCVT